MESPCTCGVCFCFLFSKVYAFQWHFSSKLLGIFSFHPPFLKACCLWEDSNLYVKSWQDLLESVGSKLEHIKIGPTVNGRNLASQLISVNMPLFTRIHTSQVVVWDFFHQQYLQTCGQFYFTGTACIICGLSQRLCTGIFSSPKDRKQLFFPSVFDMTSFDYRTITQRTLFLLKKGKILSFQGPIADICVFSLFYR